MAGVESNEALEVFVSYAHRDEELRRELVTHLALLQRQGVIGVWHDRNIDAGTEWKQAIDTHLETAHIILLLVSANFLASEYCYAIEMQRAMARHAEGTARVIPIILRAVDWSSAPFGKLQGLPQDVRPITSWPNRDEAFAAVARGLRAVAEGLRTTQPVPAAPITVPGSSPGPTQTGQPGAPRTYPGRVKIDLCSRLVADWPHLADYLDIPLSDRAGFTKGREPQGVWEWLELRGRLGELPEALAAIQRADLLEIFQSRPR